MKHLLGAIAIAATLSSTNAFSKQEPICSKGVLSSPGSRHLHPSAMEINRAILSNSDKIKGAFECDGVKPILVTVDLAVSCKGILRIAKLTASLGGISKDLTKEIPINLPELSVTAPEASCMATLSMLVFPE